MQSDINDVAFCLRWGTNQKTFMKFQANLLCIMFKDTIICKVHHVGILDFVPQKDNK